MAAARHSLRPTWLALRTRPIAARRSFVLALALALALAACQSPDVSRSLGARCDVTSDCAQKCLGPGAAWPGGFCTTACTTDADCGDDAACIDEDGGVCAFKCDNTAQCQFLGSAYSCQDRDAHGAMMKVMVCRGG